MLSPKTQNTLEDIFYMHLITFMIILFFSKRFTGELEGDAVSSEEKALLVKRYASENGILLENCHAYGDSIADLQMLESVS